MKTKRLPIASLAALTAALFPATLQADGKPVDEASFATFRALYDYDKTVPLEAQVREDAQVFAVGQVPAHRHVALSFVSAHGERVPAVLWIPVRGKRPFPGVLFLHGRGGDKENAASLALELVKDGYAVMALDAAYHGERAAGRPDLASLGLEQQRDAYVQTVVDYRRALDYLGTRDDMDARRVTLIGYSMGAIMGSLLAGVESRIQCPVLLMGGADRGLMARLTEIEVWKKMRTENPGLDFGQVSRVLAPADPLNFVDKITPRPVLMINGKRDQSIPAEAARLLHATAREPKTVVWLDSGHALSEDILPPIRSWLKKRL